MPRLYYLFLSFFLISGNAHAFEPVLDHQGMLYFNLSYDLGQTKKTEHDFGFRFDRSLVEPREMVTMNQLNAKPAVFNLKMNNDGLKAFNVNGIDYSYDTGVYHGAEGGDAKGGGEAEAQPIPDATAEPQRKIDIPLGVIIGVLIAGLAVLQ